MSEAWFALAGGLIGVLGTVLAEGIRARRADRLAARDALRLVCSQFTTDVARVRRLSLLLKKRPADADLEKKRLQDAFTDARGGYERLLITVESLAAQRAARHVVHYAAQMMFAAIEDRDDFAAAHQATLDWAVTLYAEVRRELGLRNADEVFSAPIGSLPPAG